MYLIRTTSKFNHDLKLAIRRHLDIEKFKSVRQSLIEQKPLDRKYKDHSLSGEWVGHRECHIEPDWLLIYTIEKGNLGTLVLVRTGTHSDLFE